MWRAIPIFKSVRKFYFAYNVLMQQQKYTRKQKFWIQCLQRMRWHQGVSDNLVLEMQMIVRSSSIIFQNNIGII